MSRSCVAKNVRPTRASLYISMGVRCPPLQASAEDASTDFIADLKREAEALRADSAAFAEEFGKETYESTLAGARLPHRTGHQSSK